MTNAILRTKVVWLCFLLAACAAPSHGADIVRQMAGLVPDRPHSYSGMRARLAALERLDRVSIVNLGPGAAGRPILCVAVHDPATVFGQTKRLLIIARQHGNEPSGTEAALALIQHFATSQGALETGTLQRLTFVVIPMANPGGAEHNRRRNPRGVDLNRDWQALSQPESQAIERAVRAWRPDALIDMHELPSSSSKAAYRENFVETIGSGAGIPPAVTACTAGATSDLAGWLGAYDHRCSVYYDGPGKDRRLCHRHFGLDYGIPSFLFEAKNGPGRSLRHRVIFHLVGAMVVANQLINSTQGGALYADQPDLESPRTAEASTVSAGPASVALSYDDPNSAKGPGVLASIAGGYQVQYVKFYLDGRLWFVTNTFPYRCPIAEDDLPDGSHQVRVDVVGRGGQVLAQTERSLNPVGVALGR